MADFTTPNAGVAIAAAANPGSDIGIASAMRDTEYASQDLWGQQEALFREQCSTGVYASSDRSYDSHPPAYRCGWTVG